MTKYMDKSIVRRTAITLCAIIVFSLMLSGSGTATALGEKQPIDPNAPMTRQEINEYFLSHLSTDGEYVYANYINETEVNDFNSPIIRSIEAEISKNTTTGADFFEASYYYVMAHTTYARQWSDASYPYTASNSAENEYGYCGNYTLFHIALLNAHGIPAVDVGTITSTSKFGGKSTYTLRDLLENTYSTHAFVMAFFDGEWHIADPTWGDVPGNEANYFNMSVKALSETHVIRTIRRPGEPLQIPTMPKTFVGSSAKLVIDGTPVPEFRALTVDETNHLGARDFAYALTEYGTNSGKTYTVFYNPEDFTSISIISGVEYTPTGNEFNYNWTSLSGRQGGLFIVVDGIQSTMRRINVADTNYFALRDLCSALNIHVDWDQKNQTIIVDTHKPYSS